MTFFNYKYWLTIFSCAHLIGACGQTTKSAKTSTNSISKITSLDTSNIAIITFDNSIYWLFDSTSKASDLSQSDILEIEKLFNESIIDYNSKLSTEFQKENFAVDFVKMKYKRQYVCVTNKNGQKEVYINCFCNSFGSDWKKSLLQVDDGGNCFFNFKINLATKKYFDFFVNATP